MWCVLVELIFSFNAFHKVMPYSFLFQSVLLNLCISEMFSLSLVACHNASAKTFHVNVSSLPSVSELLEGMAEYLGAKYGTIFPEIPELFLAGDDAPCADIPSPSVIPPPDAPLVQASPTTIVMEPSFSTALESPLTTALEPLLNSWAPSSTNAMPSPLTTASASSSTQLAPGRRKFHKEKVLCHICGEEQAYSNLARHLRIHTKKSSWFKCDVIPCLYSTPREDLLQRHKELCHR